MKEKTMYSSPQTLVLEVKSEEIICASSTGTEIIPTLIDMTDPFEGFSETEL